VQKWCNFRARVRGDERAIPGGRQNHGWAESLGVPVILDFRFSNFEFRSADAGEKNLSLHIWGKPEAKKRLAVVVGTEEVAIEIEVFEALKGVAGTEKYFREFV